MITIAAFSEIVSMIYAAAVSPDCWDNAVAHIHQAMLADATGIGQPRSTTLAFADGVSRSMTGNLEPEADLAYGQYYGRLDFVLQAVERGPIGQLRTGTELIAPRTRSEFYIDWVHPNGLGDGIFVRLTTDAKPTSFVVAGTPGCEPFDNEERTELLSLLVPHLQQALRTQNKLSNLSRNARELAAALDSVEHGIAIVRSDFRIVHANAEAERILREGDGLTTFGARLATGMAATRAKLDALLDFALDGDRSGVRHGGSVVCYRSSGRRPYAIHVLPLEFHRSEFVSHSPAAMVVIVDPERPPMTAVQSLRQLFGLTKTEATVAQLVLNGQGLGPIGDQLQLSRDTVKTHLRNVFHKTGTHRQAELVRLLLAVTV